MTRAAGCLVRVDIADTSGLPLRRESLAEALEVSAGEIAFRGFSKYAKNAFTIAGILVRGVDDQYLQLRISSAVPRVPFIASVGATGPKLTPRTSVRYGCTMLVTSARRKYRDQWVALRVQRTDRADVPVEGEVVLHAADRGTFEAQEQRYRGAHPDERLYVFFAGKPIPEGLGVCLGRW